MNQLPYFLFIEESEGSILFPQKEGDLGYDVRAVSEPRIVGKPAYCEGLWTSVDYIEYDLGIKIDGFQPLNSPHEDIATLIFPRSSLSGYNLLLANSVGVVDSGYRGNLKVRFKYVFQPEDLKANQFGQIVGKVNAQRIYKSGDKVCQLVFHKHFHPTIELVEKLEDSERNEGGFGSTN
jgi:dUTPase